MLRTTTDRKYNDAVGKNNPVLGLRVEQSLLDRLDALAAVIPGGTRPGIAKYALELGIRTLETDPRFAPPALSDPKRKK